MQTHPGLLNALSKPTVSNNLIRSFVIIIVALGISSVLVVSVVQKRREIGIHAGHGHRAAAHPDGVLAAGRAGCSGRPARCSALAFGLLVVFLHVFKSPDGGTLFSPQLDPMLVLLACGVGLAAAAAAAIAARSAARRVPVQALRA